ncbi:F-box domain protein, partial [Metarhizium brunneum ARSEF 3297]
MFDWTDASLVDSLTAVTTLSISLTDRVFAFDEDEEIDEDLSDCGSEDKEADRQPTQRDQEIMTESGQEGNFTGLASFIAACPRLSHFELHYLSIVWPKRRLLINFPRQDILRIRGASVREADLLNLIQRTKAVEISAEVIRLEEGTLRPVIDYCISKSAAVTKLHIDTVLEKSDQGYTGLVHFLDEGESRKYAGKFVVGTEILNREGDNRTKPVKYYVRRPIAEGNPAIYHWSALRRRGYGY